MRGSTEPPVAPPRRGFVHFLYRHRRGLLPWVGLVLGWVIGAVLHQLARTRAFEVSGSVLMSAAVVIIGVRYLYRDRAVRNRVRVATIFTGSWWLLAIFTSPVLVVVVWAWIGGWLGCSMWWWTNKRLAMRVRAEGIIDAWTGRVAADLGMSDAEMPPDRFTVTPSGWEAVLVGVNSDRVKNSVGDIAAKLRLRRGRLRAEETPMAHETVLIYDDTDDTVTSRRLVDPAIESIMDPIVVGYERGAEITVRLFREGYGALHMLVAGMTGSGKSSFVNMLIAHVIKAPDALCWLIDLKGGQEFAKWTRAADWLVTEKPDAVTLMRELQRVIQRRSRLSIRLRMGTCWKPSAKYPVICVFLDEAAELTGDPELMEAIRVIKSNARRARSVGVFILIATQLPTNEAIGSTQIKGQMSTKVCFRLNRKGDARHILNATHVDVSALPGDENPGHCYIEVGAAAIVRVHTVFLEEADAETIVETYGRDQPTVEAETVPMLSDGYVDRDRDPLGTLTAAEFAAWFGMEAPNRDGDEHGDERDSAGQDRPRRGDASYWDSLTGADGGDERKDAPMADRPARYGDDFDPADVYSDDFPPVGNPDTKLSQMRPPGDGAPRPRSPHDQSGPEQKAAAFDAALRAAGADGLSPAELVAASGFSRSTVQRRLEQMLEDATVSRIGSAPNVKYIRVAVSGRVGT